MVERVDEPLRKLDEMEQARRISEGFHAPQRVWDERDEALRRLRAATLGGGDDSFAGLTAEEIAAEVAEIERRVLARQHRQNPS